MKICKMLRKERKVVCDLHKNSPAIDESFLAVLSCSFHVTVVVFIFHRQ